MKGNKALPIVDLPNDIIENLISSKLSLQDLARLARTSKEINSLFKKPLLDAKLTLLLQHVAFGEQDQAEKILKADPALLLMKGKVTDLSLRTFNDITAFQYALWALDWHMWTMIKKYLPIKAQAEQFNELETNGTEHGKQYDLTPLLDALQVYADNAAKWNYDQRAVDQWCKKVGGAQKLLPVHVVNEYCRPDRPFNPCPAEWTSPLPRLRAVEIYINSQWVKSEWFFQPNFSDYLGSSRAFCRAAGAFGRFSGAGGIWGPIAEAASDLRSLQALWNARTKQLEALKTKLDSAVEAEERLHDHIVEQINQQIEVLKQASPINAKEKAREFYSKGKTAFYTGDKSSAMTFFLQARDNYKDLLTHSELDLQSKKEAEKRLSNLKNPEGKYSPKKLTP